MVRDLLMRKSRRGKDLEGVEIGEGHIVEEEGTEIGELEEGGGLGSEVCGLDLFPDFLHSLGDEGWFSDQLLPQALD